MFGRRKYVWKALVWVMIPLTLVTAFPRMHCNIARAQGKMFAPCCFEKDPTAKDSGSRRCCCQRGEQSKESASKTAGANSSDTQCLKCDQLSGGKKKGNCCGWTSAILSAPSAGVTPSVPLDFPAWDMILCDDAASVLATYAPHGNASALLPQMARLAVSQHLVI